MTRFQTYQTEYGFITIDTHTEQAPTDYLDGPFDVTTDDADLIQQGADIQVDGDNLIVTALDGP